MMGAGKKGNKVVVDGYIEMDTWHIQRNHRFYQSSRSCTLSKPSLQGNIRVYKHYTVLNFTN